MPATTRRTFLTLLASAPIAALAPWPAILDRYAVGDVFTVAGTQAVNPPHRIVKLVIGPSSGATWTQDLAQRISSELLTYLHRNDDPVRNAVGQWIDDASRSS